MIESKVMFFVWRYKITECSVFKKRKNSLSIPKLYFVVDNDFSHDSSLMKKRAIQTSFGLFYTLDCFPDGIDPKPL
ncbi:hypothetical protein M0811_04654 [Anaeramoeba ignava]|uniref:Uncharacterized protein n=1 Tax=Anaeramoeba ignava TaxID=1746090 RepID=A0A9Q0LUJ6_ANAIG|nr:hypothetical protein M0811_04654 [Anaeramoeba ignava]